MIDGSLIERARQTLLKWKSEGRPWMGYLLGGAILLFLLCGFCLVATGLIALSTVAGRGNSEASKGIPMAIFWLFAVLSVVAIGLFYFWWQFFRGEGPRRGPTDLAAAQAGDGPAAHRLGRHYRHRDPGSARAWLAQAAHAGVPEAMVDLALDLREGRGGPRDLASARGWLLRAQAAGAPGAKEYLAEVEAQLGDRHSDLGF